MCVLFNAGHRCVQAHVPRDSSIRQELQGPGQDDAQGMNAVVSDPRTVAWRREVTRVLGGFMLQEGQTFLLKCPEAPASEWLHT